MTDLQRDQALKDEIMKNFSAFFEVLAPAIKEAHDKNETLSAAHVKTSLKSNEHLFLNTPKLAPASDQLDEKAQREKAKKQVELDGKLALTLGMFGMTPRLITEVAEKLIKSTGQSVTSQQEQLAHPKLKRSKSAASFLDAYKQFQDAVDSKNPEKVEDAVRNVNELVLQYKNKLQNTPKLQQQPKLEQKPQYTPKIKPTPM